jgi:hypothetical protein
MTPPAATIRRWFTVSDASVWSTLALRALVILFCFIPWDWHFQREAFVLSDADPFLVQAALARGWNVADPAFWPSPARYLALPALAALAVLLLWLLLARLRRILVRRWGAGPLAIVVLGILFVGGFIGVRSLVNGGILLPGTFQGFYYPGITERSLGFPVLDGWVKARLLWPQHLDTRVILLLPWVGAMELVMLLAQGQALLRDARDGALRARLAPHFLFNALNTLHAQIEGDPRAALATTERLAGLFRQVLEVSEHATLPLRRELAFVEDYLGIERARLGDRLRVRVTVPESLLDCPIPVLALQTLVENAVKHGVSPLEAGGEVHIGAVQSGPHLDVWVEDPGTGRASGGNGTGRALENLRQRLGRAGDLRMGRVGGKHRASFRVRMS